MSGVCGNTALYSFSSISVAAAIAESSATAIAQSSRAPAGGRIGGPSVAREVFSRGSHVRPLGPLIGQGNQLLVVLPGLRPVAELLGRLRRTEEAVQPVRLLRL